MPDYSGTYKTCDTMAKVNWLVAQLHKQPVFAFDTETSGGNFLTDHIFVVSFSWKSGSGYCIDFRDFTASQKENIWESLRIVFGNKSNKVTQNGTFDIKFLWANKVNVVNWYCDTILMDHLLNENVQHGLEHLAKRYTKFGGYHDILDQYVEDNSEADPSKCQLEDGSWKKTKTAIDDGDKIIGRGTYEKIPKEMLDIYACQDADVTLRVYYAMLPKIYDEKLDWLLFNIQMPTQRLLSRVEYSGVSVDLDYLKKLKADYEKKMEVAWKAVLDDEKVQELTCEKMQQISSKWENSKVLRKKMTMVDYLDKNRDKWEFKASTKQLNDLIIGKYKQKAIKVGKAHKKTGVETPSMDAEVLNEYATQITVCKHIQEYRTCQHLMGTFIDGMMRVAASDGRVRSNYPLFRTVTGRPSSFNPNLNNIPRKANEIKGQFVADKGCYLVEADLSQIEFRIWANYSKDPQMLSDINSGFDIHKIVAALGKGRVIPKEGLTKENYKTFIDGITKEERNTAKTIVFGMMYGRKEPSIAKELGIKVSQARKIVNAFFNRYPVAQQWLLKTVTLARRDSCVTNIYGRKRRLLYINSMDQPALKSKAERQSVNCVDAETEVLTKRGWIIYQYLTLDDYILTKNSITQQLEWQKPDEINIFPHYAGEVYEFKSKCFSAITTSNHRWLVDINKGRKSVVKTSDNLSMFGDHRIHRTGEYAGSKVEVYSDDFVELIGWVLTDGYFKKSKTYNNSGVGICQSLRAKPYNVNSIDMLLSKLNLKVYRQIKKFSKCVYWEFWGDIAKQIKILFPKRILTCDFLYSLTKRQLNILLNTMLRGDGNVDKKFNKSVFYTRTIAGADVFQLLCLLNGYATSVRWRDVSKYKHESNKLLQPIKNSIGVWNITILQRNRVQVMKSQRKIYNVKKFLMWCPTVKNSFFVARRKGFVYITGNSPIQGAASDTNFLAAVRIYEEMKKRGLKSRLVLTVYDSLIYNIKPNEAEEMLELMHTEMLRGTKFIEVALNCEVKIGYRWGQLEEVKYDGHKPQLNQIDMSKFI